MVFKKDVGIVDTNDSSKGSKSSTEKFKKITEKLETITEKINKEEKIVSVSKQPKKKGFIGFVQKNVSNIIIALIVFIVAGFIAVALINRSNAPVSEIPTDPEPTVETIPVQVIDKDEYEGVLLEETPNAGEKYLEETIFIGDSNTNRFQTFDLVPYSQTLAWDGMGIRQFLTKSCIYFSGISGAMTIPEAIEIVQPRRIIFNFGTNDLKDLSAEEFIEHYGEALDAIDEAYPYSDVIIASIHPIGDYIDKAFNNEAVNEFNAALLDLAKERGLRYLNYYELLVDENGYIKEEYVDNDGLHLTREAVEDLVEYLLTHSLDTEDTRPMPLEDIPKRGYPPTPVPTVPPAGDGGTGNVSTGLNIGYITSQIVARSGQRGLNAGETTQPGPAVGYTASGGDAAAGMEEVIIGSILGQFAGGGNITNVNVSYSAADITVAFTVTYDIIIAAPVVQTPEPTPVATPEPAPPTPAPATPAPEPEPPAPEPEPPAPAPETPAPVEPSVTVVEPTPEAVPTA